MIRAFPVMMLLVGVAHAQAVDPECEAQDPTTAEVNAREGVRLAKDGKFEQAVPLFRIAVRLDPCSPAHELLLARALARIGERAEATERYERVVSEWPESPAAQRARVELKELKARPPEPEKKAPEPAPPVAEAATPAKARPPWLMIGAITAGVGVALVGGGIAFALDAQAADDDLGAASQDPDRRRYDELVDQRDSSSTLAYVFYGVGGALVAGGVTMAALEWLLPERPRQEAGSSLGLVPTQGGFQLQMGFEF